VISHDFDFIMTGRVEEDEWEFLGVSMGWVQVGKELYKEII
jgi:hypothetical protein